MSAVFVDTSAWLACVNRKAAGHAVVSESIEREPELVTSTHVFDETVARCRDLGHERAVAIGQALRSGAIARLVETTSADLDEAWGLFISRPDKDYSFTDCTSFVLMRRLRIRAAIALDEDFAREGFVVAPELLAVDRKRRRRS